jgi:hypothetical protein
MPKRALARRASSGLLPLEPVGSVQKLSHFLFFAERLPAGAQAVAFVISVSFSSCMLRYVLLNDLWVKYLVPARLLARNRTLLIQPYEQ